MTDLRKAAEMALDTLTKSQPLSNLMSDVLKLMETIRILRQALAQPEQEPVTWRNAAIRLGEDLYSVDPDGYYDMTAEQWLDWALSVVTAPPSKPFVFLTKEDMPSGDHPMYDTKEFYAGMAWAQTKLKEKNT